MSAGQFGRRTFLTTTGAATAGAILATSLPTPAHAAPADSAATVGFSSDGNPFVTNIYPVDPDAFVGNGRRDDGDRTAAQAEDLVTSATLLSSTILQSTSS